MGQVRPEHPEKLPLWLPFSSWYVCIYVHDRHVSMYVYMCVYLCPPHPPLNYIFTDPIEVGAKDGDKCAMFTVVSERNIRLLSQDIEYLFPCLLAQLQLNYYQYLTFTKKTEHQDTTATLNKNTC